MRLTKLMPYLAIFLFISTGFSSCSSYEYRPYRDSVYACFDNVNASKGEVLTNCHKTNSYTDYTKVHEMSATEKRFMPNPVER